MTLMRSLRTARPHKSQDWSPNQKQARIYPLKVQERIGKRMLSYTGI